VMDQGDGYFYIANMGCRHRKEMFKKAKDISKLNKLNSTILKVTKEWDKLVLRKKVLEERDVRLKKKRDELLTKIEEGNY